MGMIHVENGTKSREWRVAVRTLRRIIEVSRGVHSLYDVHQYIKDPHEFFNDIRSELKHLSNTKQEFNEIVEEAEAWYLSYIHTIEQEEKDLEVSSDQGLKKDDEFIDTEETNNVIHLFKNLSEPSIPKEVESKPTKKAKEKNSSKQKSNSISKPEKAKTKNKIKVEDKKPKSKSKDSKVPTEPKVEKNNEVAKPAAKHKDITVDELPDNIVPGTWLEIYQGEDKAKRRLKFSTTLTETNCLLFTDRSGDFILEIDMKTFMDDLESGRTRLINESNRFDLALSSVISNIRNSQN